MAESKKEWKCKPCGHENNGDEADICMICSTPRSNTKMKIVNKNGRRSVTYTTDKRNNKKSNKKNSA